MGYRLNVAKKYDIQYSPNAWFNHGSGEFNSFLSKLASDTGCYAWFNNEESDRYSDEIEVSKGDWQQMVAELKERNPEEIAMVSCGDEYTVKEMVDIMQEIYEDADPYNDLIHLFWF